MANYTAQIRIGVQGQQDLKNLQNQLEYAAAQVDKINDAFKLTPQALSRSLQTIQNYNEVLSKSTRVLQTVQAGHEQETVAVKNYVTALGTANAAAARQNKLIEDEIALRKTQERQARLRAAGIREEANQTRSPAGPMAPTAGQTRRAVTSSEEYLQQRRAAAFEERLGSTQRRNAETEQRRQARGQKAESVALGVGFPLMFGAGPGSVAGSLAGSFAGSGFGGQILGGAIGAAFDKIGVAAIEAGKSLAYPIEGFEKLKEASLFASREQEYYISKLIETGRVAEATAVIQAEMIKKIGVRGVNDLAALGESSIQLSKAWAEFNLQLQAALAGPLADLTLWLAGIIGEGNKIREGQAKVKDVRAGLSGKDLTEFDKRLEAIGRGDRLKIATGSEKFMSISEIRKREVALAKEFESRSKPQTARGTLTPEDREKAIKAAEQQADTIKDAYRTGFRLQQQGLDLQRQGSDLQRRVAQDIYNKQQEILRLQVDNDRQRKQVAIEMVDLEYRRRIFNEEGRVAAVLEAEAALMKTKAEGEANIEAKKRLLELDIDKQKRETENYIFELGRTIDGIRRSTLSLEMDVADYRLKIERQIGEQRRIEEAGQAAGAPTGGGMGKVIEYFTGDPKLGAAGGYRADHSGSNYHDHIAYKTAKEAKEAAALLNRSGIKTTELKGVNPVGGHARGSYHYSGQAFDVPGAQVPVGQEPALSAKVRKILQIGGGTAKPLPSWLGPIAKGANKPAGSMETQLQNAAGQAIIRPNVQTPDVGGIGAARIKMDKQDTQIRREALSIEQQLQSLREQGALDRLAEVARGDKEIQQRKDALAYAKADLATIGAASQDKQELLAFEAQSAVKLKLKEDENLKISNQIKANDALTKEQKTYVLGKVQEALDIAKQQIALDKEALVIAQQTRFEKEKAAIQAQLGVTGKGLQAGFIGQAGQAFESEMLKSGNVEQAQALAAQTQALELATTKARALEGAYNDIGSAMASTLTDGVAGLVAGTTTAEQVFSDFLKNIGQALMKAAQQMIAQYLAIAAAKALAGLFGGGSSAIAGGSTYGGAASSSIFSAGTGTAFGGMSIPGFAAGGNPPVGRPSLVGEKGPELFVPRTAGTIIPADATAAAMARYQRQGSGSGAGSSSDAMGAGEATPVLSMSFETTRFMDRDWVDKDQLVAAMAATERRAAAAGAKAGAAQVTSRLQQSPNYRRQVGLR